MAEKINAKPLAPQEIVKSEGEVVTRAGFDVRTPLWFYILKEFQATRPRFYTRSGLDADRALPDARHLHDGGPPTIRERNQPIGPTNPVPATAPAPASRNGKR